METKSVEVEFSYRKGSPVLRMLYISFMSMSVWASEVPEGKTPTPSAAHESDTEAAPPSVKPRLTKAEAKSFIGQLNSKITSARGRCKPYLGKLSARDTENGCAEAFEKAAEVYNTAPPEVRLSSEFQNVIPAFEELSIMKDERLRRASEWLRESTAAKKKAEGFDGLKDEFALNLNQYEAYKSAQCEALPKQFLELIERIQKIRKSPDISKYCKWSDAKDRNATQAAWCEVLATRKEDDETVLLACLRREVTDWGARRILQDLRNLERGTFFAEERVRKTKTSLEEALEEKLKPWLDVAQKLELSWYKEQTFSRALEKQKEFAEAFAKATTRECVNSEDFTAMDSRASEVTRLLGKDGAKVQKTFLSKAMTFEQNSNKEVTGRFQHARAVYSRAGDSHCWVAAATYYSKHFGSDKWSPWSYTFEGQWLTQDGKIAAALPCRCK